MRLPDGRTVRCVSALASERSVGQSVVCGTYTRTRTPLRSSHGNKLPVFIVLYYKHLVVVVLFRLFTAVIYLNFYLTVVIV